MNITKPLYLNFYTASHRLVQTGIIFRSQFAYLGNSCRYLKYCCSCVAELIAFAQGVLGVGTVGSPYLLFGDWLSLLNYVLHDMASCGLVIDWQSKDSSGKSLGAIQSINRLCVDLEGLGLLVSHLLLPFVAAVGFLLHVSDLLLNQLETTSRRYDHAEEVEILWLSGSVISPV